MELIDLVKDHVTAQQVSFRAGYDAGYIQGKLDGIKQSRAIVDRVFPATDTPSLLRPQAE